MTAPSSTQKRREQVRSPSPRASDPLVIYGANGYTGRLIAEEAVAFGLRPILAGRNGAAITALAARLGLESRVATLELGPLTDLLLNVRVVVNAAGPFRHTTAPMIAACLASGAHYLDVSGEARAFEMAAGQDAVARSRGVMVMPGAGFDVVPSDCLALHVARRQPGTRRLAIGITGLRSASRGSALTTIDEIGRPVLVRRGGALVEVPPASLEHHFDYGQGPRASLAVSWADVVSAYYSTGVPDIAVYFEATPPVRAALTTSRHLGPLLGSDIGRSWLRAWSRILPEGPGEAERRTARAVIVAEAEDADGARRVSRLQTPEVYTTTALAATRVAARILVGDCAAGFQTPARLYGPDFVLTFPGVSREDLPAMEPSVNRGERSTPARTERARGAR